jgi:LmeA-like phospholipid-binding
VADRRPRRSRAWLVVLVVLLVLAGLLVAADRVAQGMVQNRAAQQIQSELGLDQPPNVDLGPFPFLPEVVVRRLDTTNVKITEVAIPGTEGATANDLDATLGGVTLDEQFQPVRADRGDATARVSYATLSTLTGLDITYAGPDRIRVRFEVALGEAMASGTITGRPVLDVEAQAMRIEEADIQLDSEDAPQGELDAVGELVLRSIPLQGLPEQVRLTSLTVREDGAQVGLTGEDLPLRR